MVNAQVAADVRLATRLGPPADAPETGQHSYGSE